MKFVWFFLVIGLLVVVSDAKRKRKFEGDFEFADEVCSLHTSIIYTCIHAFTRRFYML